jgi:hypothetical protein
MPGDLPIMSDQIRAILIKGVRFWWDGSNDGLTSTSRLRSPSAPTRCRVSTSEGRASFAYTRPSQRISPLDLTGGATQPRSLQAGFGRRDYSDRAVRRRRPRGTRGRTRPATIPRRRAWSTRSTTRSPAPRHPRSTARREHTIYTAPRPSLARCTHRDLHPTQHAPERPMAIATTRHSKRGGADTEPSLAGGSPTSTQATARVPPRFSRAYDLPLGKGGTVPEPQTPGQMIAALPNPIEQLMTAARPKELVRLVNDRCTTPTTDRPGAATKRVSPRRHADR